MLISKTPLRISFFGGGTDYPIYYKRRVGAVLGTTINKYIYISLNRLISFLKDKKIRISYARTEFVKSPAHIQHPSVRACLLNEDIQDCLDIHIFSDIPAKTGLGSSSSFTVGLLKALHHLKNVSISQQALAEKACYIEQEKIGENVGSQDQFHAAFGGFNLMHFSKKGVQVEPLILPEEKIHALEKHLLLFYTGLTRFASDVAHNQIEKTAQRFNDPILEQMYEMTFLAKELLINSSCQNCVKEFGTLLYESWLLKKQLSENISTDRIDEALSVCMDNGAYGGKLLGAGSGGFLAIFAPLTAHKHIMDKLSFLQKVDVQFEKEGSTIIYEK